MEELIEAFKLEGVNRSNAVVNFTEEDPIDPKAMWLNVAAYPHDAGGRTRCQTAAIRACGRLARAMKPKC